MAVGFASKGLSAIGRLAAIALLAGAFLFGLAGVVYMSLQGAEVQVPEITGKDLSESEKELALLGLKIKKRADRASSEAPNTVIEQLPKPGETVKTGQMILVVTSKGLGEGEKSTIKKGIDEDDSEKIEEMLDDKPKKPKANSNTNRKKADTTRDVGANTGEGNSNSNSNESNSNKKEPSNNAEKNKNAQTPTGPKPANPATRPGEARPKLRQ
jgi:beta-lactam-binding protein with PASTA domain